MIDPQSPDVLEEKAAPLNNHPGNHDGLDELRRLLVGPEQQEIVRLQKRLDEQDELLPEDVGRVLPEAVRLRSRQDKKVTEALLPTVEEAIGISVRKNPQTLVDAIFPVIGPAIRRAIAEALTGMVQTMNQTLEHSFSAQGLKWRLEAWRTGKSFGEVVLLHTLLYRVEQVFLIHRETGLLLQHVVAGTSSIQDADMVSGMLTAIQDFVHDSFSSQQSDTLETLQVGGLTVWIEQGPRAILAGVIRGNAPQELRTVFQETLERIHLEFSRELESFEGEAAVFDPTREYLEACLQVQYDQSRQPGTTKKSITPARVIAALLLGVILIWGFFYLRDRWRWGNHLSRLKSEPGIIVTDAERHWWSPHSITGLRDPLAADPQVLLTEAKLNPEKVESHWEPYHSLTPRFIVTRANALLNPPATVAFRVERNTLYATGSAPHQWIVETRRLARVIPGVEQFSEAELVDANFSQLLSAKERVEKRAILFVLDTTEMSPGQDDELERLSADLRELYRLAPAAGKSVRFEVVGHTDKIGTEETNLQLSRDRAEQVRARLAAKLGDAVQITAIGVGSREPLREEQTEEDKRFNRSVTVRVTFFDA
ncbi:MAG: OmpA family protein [Acidobacteria bacterium]|nr:OmpA family protein [Acidobacteriota bacterium]